MLSTYFVHLWVSVLKHIQENTKNNIAEQIRRPQIQLGNGISSNLPNLYSLLKLYFSLNILVTPTVDFVLSNYFVHLWVSVIKHIQEK